MSDTGADRVPSFLGRVLDDDGAAAGSCFQFPGGIIVTAWHVLADLGRDVEGAEVATDVLDGPPAAAAARVLSLDPARDLAVLHRERPFASSAPGLAVSGAVRLRTDGYVMGVSQVDDPGHDYGLVTATGTWEGPVRRDGVDIARFSSTSVLPGMSGAPLLRIADDVVLGVVSGRYNSAGRWLRDSVWISCAEHIAEILGTVPGLRLHPEIVLDSGAAGSVLTAPPPSAGTVEPPETDATGPGEAAFEAATILRGLDASCRRPGALGDVVNRLVVETALGERLSGPWATRLRERLRRHGLDARVILPGLPDHDRAVRQWEAPLGADAERETGRGGAAAMRESLVRAFGEQLESDLFRHVSPRCRSFLRTGLAGERSPATLRFLQHLARLLPPLASTSTQITVFTPPSKGTPQSDAPRSERDAGPGYQRLIRSAAQRMARLPEQDPYFIGRDELLTRVTEEMTRTMADRGSAIAYLSGQPGAGTSTVAIEAARRLADRFADGVYYVDLLGLVPGRERGPRTVVRILSEALGVDMGADATDEDEGLDRFFAALADRSVLLLLDNARDAAHVAPLARRADSCAIVITSRDRLQDLADPALAFGADPMHRTESIGLLQLYLGGRPADPTALDGIADLCADVPLALRVVGARLMADPRGAPEELRSALANESTRLDYLEAGARAVRAAIALSYGALSEDARQALRLITAFPGAAVTARSFAHCAERDAFRQEFVLHRLADRNLADRAMSATSFDLRESQFSLFELIRLFAVEQRDREESPEDLAAFQERAVRFLLARLEEINDLAPDAEVSGELDPAVFHVAEELAERLDLLPVAVDFALNLWTLYSSRKELDGLTRMIDVRVRLLLRTGDPAGAAAACEKHAEKMHEMGAAEEAVNSYRESLQICDAYRLPEAAARVHFKLSTLFGDAGEFHAALEHGRTAAEMFLDVNWPQDALSAALNNSRCCQHLEDWEGMLFWCGQALRSVVAHQDQTKFSMARYDAGWAHTALGRPAEGLRLFEEAEEIDTSLEHWRAAGICARRAARNLDVLERPAEATGALVRSAAHLARGKDPALRIHTLIELSARYLDAGENAEAASSLAEAAEFAPAPNPDDPIRAVPDDELKATSLLRREARIRGLLLRDFLGLSEPAGSALANLEPETGEDDPGEPDILDLAVDLVRDWKIGRVPDEYARSRLRELLTRPTFTPLPSDNVWFYKDIAGAPGSFNALG